MFPRMSDTTKSVAIVYLFNISKVQTTNMMSLWAFMDSFKEFKNVSTKKQAQKKEIVEKGHLWQLWKKSQKKNPKKIYVKKNMDRID